MMDNVKNMERYRFNMGKKFTEKHLIPYYDCDVLGQLKVPRLIEMMIKASGSQCDSLGLTNEFIASFGLSWIITEHDLIINRLPLAEEEVSVTSEAESYNKFFSYRKYWIHSASGEELAVMESTFALMNIKERTVNAAPLEIMAPFESEKIKKIRHGEKIPERTQDATKQAFHVSFWDIDNNYHVNNTVYSAWMIDSHSFDFLIKYRPKRLLIKYNKEIRYDEQVMVFVDTNQDNTFYHVDHGSELCAEGKIEWIER